jgi:hypothetical protein
MKIGFLSLFPFPYLESNLATENEGWYHLDLVRKFITVKHFCFEVQFINTYFFPMSW